MHNIQIVLCIINILYKGYTKNMYYIRRIKRNKKKRSINFSVRLKSV